MAHRVASRLAHAVGHVGLVGALRRISGTSHTAGERDDRRTLRERPAEVDDVSAGELSAADLAVPGGLIQALRSRLHDGRVEPQLTISKLAGAVLEASEDQPSKAAAPKRRVDADPLELSDLVGHMAKGARRDQASVVDPYEEFTAVVYVRGRVQGILPRTVTELRLIGDRIVKLAHSPGVGGLEASHCEHADHSGGCISGIHG